MEFNYSLKNYQDYVDSVGESVDNIPVSHIIEKLRLLFKYNELRNKDNIFEIYQNSVEYASLEDVYNGVVEEFCLLMRRILLILYVY